MIVPLARMAYPRAKSKTDIVENLFKINILVRQPRTLIQLKNRTQPLKVVKMMEPAGLQPMQRAKKIGEKPIRMMTMI